MARNEKDQVIISVRKELTAPACETAFRNKIIREALEDEGKEFGYLVDTKVFGLCLRCNAAGSQTWVFRYRIDGKQRVYKFGEFPFMSLKKARKRASKFRQWVAKGKDPAEKAARKKERTRKKQAQHRTVADLADRFREKAMRGKAETTQRDYNICIDKYILPTFGNRSLASLEKMEVEDFHCQITEDGYSTQANRAVNVLAAMINTAEDWGWKVPPKNPCKGVQMNAEEKRERYLDQDELQRLTVAMDKHPDRQAMNVIAFLLATGCRKGEALKATWGMFRNGVWTKPAATTKQLKMHSIPLTASAQAVLMDAKEWNEVKGRDSEYVFPGLHNHGHRTCIHRPFKDVCKMAGIDDLRVHDLRHTFASFGVGRGLSLYQVGALLGHSRAETTQRYAHLDQKPLRDAAVQIEDAMRLEAPVT